MRYPAGEKAEIIRLVEQSSLPVRRTLERSCPIPWCNCGGVVTAISGGAGIGQAAGMGRLTRGSSLKGARVSRVM